MKKYPILALLFFWHMQVTKAQQNCSNPLLVSLCPATVLTGQTNLGMIDDFTGSCNLAGEDLVYQFTTNPGATRVYVSFSAVSATMRAYLTSNCATTSCTYNAIGTAPINLTYTVSGNVTYYLWIDAGSTVTYNISIGGDTSSTFVSIPNTQGNLGFDNSGCATPLFKSSKPFYQVSYNGVYQTDPMTLAPLNVPGILCLVVYFKNTTGIEAIKQFDFYYNPSGFSSFLPVSSTLPGFYLPGNWLATSGTNKWTFTFYDTLGIGKGDFALLPNTCLRYEFCFNVTPLTNDPVLTNILDSARSDGYGAGFTGWIRSGCCPPGFTNCLGNPGGGSSATHAFGFGMNDPGSGGLPIVLLSFNASENNGDVVVNWITQTEINNEYFTILRSKDAMNWTPAAIVGGAGNSTSELYYTYTDQEAFEGVSYYRLKQTDYDGTSSYSQIVAVNNKKTDIRIYPNPVQDYLFVQTEIWESAEINFNLINDMGQKMKLNTRQGSKPVEYKLDLTSLPRGIYVLEIEGNADGDLRKIIVKN